MTMDLPVPLTPFRSTGLRCARRVLTRYEYRTVSTVGTRIWKKGTCGTGAMSECARRDTETRWRQAPWAIGGSRQAFVPSSCGGACSCVRLASSLFVHVLHIMCPCHSFRGGGGGG